MPQRDNMTLQVFCVFIRSSTVFWTLLLDLEQICGTIHSEMYDTIRYIYVRSKADEVAS